MIILDTNVVSALMQAVPEPAVVAWLDQQPAESIWLTRITVFESRLGLALLPHGKRRRALEDGFEQLLREDRQNRVLSFDAEAAAQAAALGAARQKAGRVIDMRNMRDTQIASIAAARRATLATRHLHHLHHLRHFDDLKTPVLSPWALARAAERMRP